MLLQFTYPPEAYAAETARSSWFWWLYLPLTTAVILPFIAWFDGNWYAHWMVSEQTGFLEFLHTIFPLAIAIIALSLLFRPLVRADPLLIFWFTAMIAGGIYLAGEEASWGQHYIGWTTPEYWAGVNDQQETNLHNTSQWLDQKPRLLLTLGIVLTGLIFPLVHLRAPNLLPRRFDLTYPPLALWVLAALVLFTELFTAFKSLFPLDLTTALRPGEWQELYIVWFMLYYTLFLKWRLDELEKAADRV